MTARALPQDWLRTDALVAVGMALLSTCMVWIMFQADLFDTDALWAAMLGCVGLTLPLALRRRFPLSVAVAVNALYIVLGNTVGVEPFVSQVALFLALYSAGAWSAARKRALWVRVLICTAMAVWLGSAIISKSIFGDMPVVSSAALLYQLVLLSVFNLSFFVGAWVFGDRAWTQSLERAELEQAYQDIRALKEELVAHAVEEERLRIARELHDVVAHHVTSMSVQSAAARRLLTSDPARAAESLKHVEASARLAVGDLRSMVLTLRGRDSGHESLPTLADLDDLVASARTGGVQVQVERIGRLPELTPAQELTLYRVAQEALTNVAKHAGASTQAVLRLRPLLDCVELEVSDSGAGTRHPVPGTGTGLTGMRERVAALGGTLEVGPKPRGGFLVRAAIPTGGAR